MTLTSQSCCSFDSVTNDSISYVTCVPIASINVTETQDTDFCTVVCLVIFPVVNIDLNTFLTLGLCDKFVHRV